MYETGFLWNNKQTGVQAASLFRFLDHTQLDNTDLIRLFCTSDRTVSETTTTQQTQNTNIHAVSLSNLQSQHWNDPNPVLDRVATAIGTCRLNATAIRNTNGESLGVLKRIGTGSLSCQIAMCVPHLSYCKV
jgi:hypothetical protein